MQKPPLSSNPPGLPPVTPPSGRFIVQLFVVPGLIVFAVVLVLLIPAALVRSGRSSPEYFLAQLDSANADIRWRAASDLAQVLKRPEKESVQWKTDAKFALELAERLRKAVDELARAEKELQAHVATLSTEQEKTLVWRRLEAQRNHVSYLSAALGDFHVPVGAPLLCELSLSDDSPDVQGNTLRRRQSLWALCNLGEQTRGFQKLPTQQRGETLETLRQEAAGSHPLRAKWAQCALYYLDRPSLSPSELADVVKVDEVLARCADAQDRHVRELVAMAFNFWDGPLAEPTLLRLARDDGRGTLLRVTEIE